MYKRQPFNFTVDGIVREAFLEVAFTYSTVFFPVTLYTAPVDLSVIFSPVFNFGLLLFPIGLVDVYKRQVFFFIKFFLYYILYPLIIMFF